MEKYNFMQSPKYEMHAWNNGILENQNSTIPTIHVYNEILMLERF